MGRNGRCCVIRDDREVYVPRENLTAAELYDIEQREKSPIARRQFGILLRRVRKAEDAPLKAALDAKLAPKGDE